VALAPHAASSTERLASPCYRGAMRTRTILVTWMTVGLAAACGSDPAADSSDADTDAADSGDDIDASGVPVGEVYVSSQDTLFLLEPIAGAFTKLGEFDCIALTPDPNDSQDGMADIAIDKDGQMYGIGRTVPDGLWRLVSVNKSSGACSAIAEVAQDPASLPSGLSFVPAGVLDPSDEVLVGITTGGGYYRYDLTTGAETFVGQFADGTFTKNSDLVSITDGKTYTTGGAKAVGIDALMEIDPATGALIEVVGSTGIELIAGLGFWGGTVYGFDYMGKLYAIDPTTAATTELPSSGVPAGTHFWGGAVTTSAPIDLD
jgi:hypothetical protein